MFGRQSGMLVKAGVGLPLGEKLLADGAGEDLEDQVAEDEAEEEGGSSWLLLCGAIFTSKGGLSLALQNHISVSSVASLEWSVFTVGDVWA